MTKRFLTVMSLAVLTAVTVPVFCDPAQGEQTEAKALAPVGGQVQWQTNYTQASEQAKKENKPLLLFFTGSDWCGWCKKMHQEIFSSPEFAQAVGANFIFVEVDFPMNKQLPSDLAQQNAMLKQKYGITGYPTVILISADGNFVAETGYRPGGGKAYADYLKQFIK